MSVPHDIRAHDLRTLDLSCHFLPVERALGVQWAIESDTLGLRIILKDKPLTRRGILSTICSVYDPLGIAAPFLLNGKKILQDLCRMKIDWDEEIDPCTLGKVEKPTISIRRLLNGLLCHPGRFWFCRVKANPPFLGR